MNAVEQWEARHPGFTASRPVRLWLTALGPLARLVAGVPADAVTAAGLLTSLAAAARAPRRSAAALLVAGGVLDSLDGMVAGTGSARGTRLDHGADRLSDVALLGVLRRAGAPAPLVAAAGVSVLAMEASRGPSRVVTPGERPTRVVLGCLGLLGFPRLATGALLGVTAASTALLVRDRRSR